MAVVVFLVIVVAVAVVWAVVAYLRAGTKAAHTGVDRTGGSGGPSLLEDDLSFAGRDGSSGNGSETAPSEAVDDRSASPR